MEEKKGEMDMILTRKQEEGLRIALERYKARKKYTVIAGLAGTGKSTLVRFIIEAIGLSEDQVSYNTYTGKSAQVLVQNGNTGAQTLHKLLFDTKLTRDGRFFRTPKMNLGDIKLVVVDEVSMVPKTLLNELFSHEVHVILLGDPGQLPPVSNDDDNHMLDNPHIFLDEIMRQAQESEIIRLTMDIRAGKPLKPYHGKDVIVVPKSELVDGMLDWADQIICATNRTRGGINAQMRAARGLSGIPRDGDKVICVRNYWDVYSSSEEPLINGTTGILHNTFKQSFVLPQRMYSKRELGILTGDIVTDTGSTFNMLDMDLDMFQTEQPSLSKKQEYQLSRSKYKSLLPFEVCYGYAITCHKSQGSQWKKVLTIEERFPFDKEEHTRWLYTAVTRACDKAVVVLAD